MHRLPTEVRWAFIYSIVAIGWFLFEKLMGWHGPRIEKHGLYRAFLILPSLAVYALAIREKREYFYDGNMTWIEGLKSGVMMTIFIAMLSVPVQWFSYHIISPGFFDKVIRFQVSSDMMDEKSAREYFNLSSYLVLSPIICFLAGFMTSAVVSIFVKRT